jgi:hypothetical protein
MPNYWIFLWKVWFGYVDFGVSLLWRLLLGAPESFLKTFYRIWYLRCCLFRWYRIVILFYTISPLILYSKTYATIKMLSLYKRDKGKTSIMRFLWMFLPFFFKRNVLLKNKKHSYPFSWYKFRFFVTKYFLFTEKKITCIYCCFCTLMYNINAWPQKTTPRLLLLLLFLLLLLLLYVPSCFILNGSKFKKRKK